MNLLIFKSLRSISLATLVSLLPLHIVEVLPPAYGQTPTENPQTATDKLFEQGVQQYRHGQYIQALQTYQRVLEIRRQQNNKAGIAQTLNNIGEVYGVLKEGDKALEVLQPALTIRRELKDRAGEGETLDNIGYAYYRKNQYDLALKTLQQALAIRREVKDKTGEAKTLSKMGNVYSFGFKQYDKGLELLQQALVIQEQVGDKFQAANTLNRIAATYSVQNKIDSALQFGQQALVFAKKNELLPQQIESLLGLVNVYNIRGNSYAEKKETSLAKADYSHVVELSQSALTIARVLKDKKSEAKALNELGSAYEKLNEPQKAIVVLQQAVNIAREIKAPDIESSALTNLSNIYFGKGDSNKVIEIELRQIEIAHEQNETLSETLHLMSLASTYNVKGEHQKASETYQRALTTLRQVDINKLEPNQRESALKFEFYALIGISESDGFLGKYDQALDFAQQALKKAQSLKKPELEIDALLDLAFLQYNTFKNLPKAIELSQQALAIAKQIKNPLLEANALQKLSSAYKEQGNYSLGLKAAEEMLAIAQQLQNPELKHQAFDLLGDIYNKQGNNQKALAIAQQNLVLVQTQLPLYEITALGSLSQSYIAVGDTPTALETAKQALAIAQKQQEPFKQMLSFIYVTRVYKVRGEYEQGIEVAQKALDIARHIKSFLGEVTATVGLSEMYDASGEYSKVIAVAEPNLILARKINNRDGEARLLINLGDAYRIVGDYPKAKGFIEQGLKIAQEQKNPPLESIALSSLGSYYTSLNDYQKALAVTQQSLKIAQDVKSPPLLISPFFNLGDIYNNLGDYTKSRSYYQQALATAQQLKNRQSEAIALFAQADTYFRQGEPQKTVELAQQALVIFHEIKVPRLEAFAHRMLSVGYGELSNDAKAMAEAQTYLTFARKTQNPLWEKNALNLIGDLHKKFGHKELAITAYQQALSITTDNQVTGTNAGIYAGLANIYQSLNQQNVAVTYYKLYINQIEEVRHGIQGLPPELQNSFINSTVDFNKVKIADIYRQYANLLLSQGREQEATQVLELLKIQEIKEVSTGGKTASNTLKLPLTSSESKIAAPNQSIIALGIQIRECEQKNCPQKTQLNDKLSTVLKEFNQELDKIDKEIHSRIANDKGTFDPAKLATVREIVKQPGTVMIYPLVLDDKLWLLLYSGNAAQKFEVPVKRAELGKTVKEFRDLMEECEKRACGSTDIAKIQPVSQKLYNWLIKPLESELKKNQVKNLVFALDRVTRYIPMSALFNGKQYLIENYTTYNVLSADLTDVRDKLSIGTQNNPVLAMGVSNAVGGFPALTNVPKELDAIVKNNTSNKGIYPGKEYLNNTFDYRSLRDNLTGYKILHLATHGAFVPGSKDASYLLLGSGKKLAISDIETLTGLSNIHLVVLSACQTALAAPLQDGVEIASVAYYFLNGGAKAVMASLWQVSDISTSELMQHFYQDLAQSAQPTKAESLRLAQLSLLYGKQITSENIKRGAINLESISDKPSRKTTTSANFAHPYYWAPFILIGNGL